MKFGVFDQNDRSGRPLAQQYEERLQLAELYDKSGFYCYHMSEHHATSLSTTPSQSVFLAALSQRTRRLRLCPLVYLLPVHHPMRLAEEICMLDHLSQGRFEFGIGRGASPHELEALGVDSTRSKEMYAESFEIIQQYFTSKSLNFKGQFWSFTDVPVEMQPLQRPYPPVWYAMASAESAVWPAQHGINAVCGGPIAALRKITDRYREEFARANTHQQKTPLLGINRFIVVAETDAEALDVARKAWPAFYENFIKLWRKYGTQPVNIKLPPNFDQVLEARQAIVGSPSTVASRLGEQIDEGAVNYLIGTFMFGDMPHAAALNSVGLFASEVIPAIKGMDHVVA